MTWFFWLHVIIYDYLSSVFCIVPNKILSLKYRKWVSHLKNRYHYVKVIENAQINFSISPYCILLFSRKENFKFFSSFISCSLQWSGWLHNDLWGYQHWNTANTNWTFTYFSKTAIKALKQGVNFAQTLQSVLQQLTFVLLVSFLLTFHTFHTLL